MKNRIKYWFKVFAGSYEMVAIGLLALFAVTWPQAVQRIGSIFESDQLDLKHIILAIPFIFTGFSYKYSWDILHPEKRNILMEWDEYWKLKYPLYVAGVFLVGSCISMVLGVYFFTHSFPVLGVSLGLGAIIVSGITLVSIAVARINGPDILDSKVNHGA